MKRWGIFFTILFLPILFLCPIKTKAAAPPLPLSGVVLSEVLANGEGAYEQGLEYIELLNTGNNKVDILDWEITVIYPEKGTEVTQKIIDFVGFNDITKSGYTTEIPSGGYALIVDPRYEGEYNDQIRQNSGYNLIMVTVDANYLGAGNLANEYGGVRLSDGASSVEFIWTENPGDGVSWEYDPPSDSWTASGNFYNCSPGYDNEDPPKAWGSTKYYYGKAPFTTNFSSEGSYDPEGTSISYEWDFDDGTKSLAANPTHTFLKPGNYEVVLYVWDALGLSAGTDNIEIIVFSCDIIISEVLPNPLGPDEGAEFIELYNKGSSTIDLSGWQIRDSRGSGITLKNEKIKPKSYRVFSGNFYLNNSGEESINLYFPGGIIKAASVKFSNSQSGFSFALIGGKFVWTYEPTPGKNNILAIKPGYSSTQYYTSGSSYKKYSSSNSYQPPKVFGINQTATDESLYPLGADCRNIGTKIGLNIIVKIIIWLIVIISFGILILLMIYPKIGRQNIRGP